MNGVVATYPQQKNSHLKLTENSDACFPCHPLWFLPPVVTQGAAEGSTE